MDYGLPNISIEHFTKSVPYDGDFATLFVVFSKTINQEKSIILNKVSEFNRIKELRDDKFLQKAVEVFFRNGGERLYLFFYFVEKIGFRLNKFKKKLSRECDRLNDVEVVVAINLYSPEIYNKIFLIQRVLRIQREINSYCKKAHKISISDINEDFKEEYLDLITNTIIYYPWIVDYKGSLLPPSIYASAMFSKMAKDNKYFESIANKVLYGAEDVTFRFDRERLSSLVKNRINPVIFMPHRGVMFWGVKTLGEIQDTVNELRVMKFIKRKLIKISQMYVFEPNSFELEVQISTIVQSFLEGLEKIGAVESFIVERATTNKDRAKGQMVINIEVAFSIPIEFIRIRLTKMDREGMESLLSL